MSLQQPSLPAPALPEAEANTGNTTAAVHENKSPVREGNDDDEPLT